MWLMKSTPTGPTITGPLIAFTTPVNYSDCLSVVLCHHGQTPLPIPTLHLTPTPSRPPPSPPNPKPLLRRHLHIPLQNLLILPRPYPALTPPLLSPTIHFTVTALGTDAELIDAPFLSNLSIVEARARVHVLVPPIVTPKEMVRSLSDSGGRRILCPVPGDFHEEQKKKT